MYYTFLIISLLITLSCKNAVSLNISSSQGDFISKDDELFNLDSQLAHLSISNKSSIDYSDSEEEGVPCYDMVFNYTKSNKRTFDNKLVLNTVGSGCEISLDQLSKDAKSIWSKAGENNLTVLCVVLKNAKGRLKKFVFTNQIDYSYYADSGSNIIISKSHELGYHVVQAQQSHAEGALLQFYREGQILIKRLLE